MIVDREAHRAAAARLADLYFTEQCRRMGPIKGVPRPRKAPDFSAPELAAEPPRLKPSRRPRASPRLEDFDPQIPRT